MKNEHAKFTEEILGFEDDLIVFRDFKVYPEDITHLYVDAKTRIWYILRYKYEKIFIIAGIGYLLIDLTNTGKVKEETLIVSGSLVAAGLLAKLLISKKIRIKGRRKLVIIHG